MNKTNIVTSYFEAFRAKDINTLKSILGHGFGIRTFLGSLLFSFDSIECFLNKYNLIDYNIINIEELNDTVYLNVIVEYSVDSNINNECLVIKVVFNDNLIVRVYETIKKVRHTRIKCLLSYDGSTFSGFQRQPNLITVQGEIEKGLKFLTKEDITIHSSGRTDKGVHAINQTFHFDTLSKIKPNDFARVLKSYLPDSVFIKSSELAHPTFHSRFDTYSKEYLYKVNTGEYDPIQRNYEWHVKNIDIGILKKELNSIIGTHDFTSFTKTKEDKNMIRTIFDIKIEEKDSYLYISIVGSGFLQYMVRYIVGTVIEIAKGEVDDSLLNFINYKNSSEVKWKAPSSGLYLKEVIYDE